MNRNDAIITIAEVRGWKRLPGPNPLGLWIHPANNGGRYYLENELPDYLTDLNAINEAELSLSDKSPGKDKNGDSLPSDRARYRVNLCLICMNSGGPISASAAQRSEAFIKTVYQS